jgi:hypothetical protein
MTPAIYERLAGRLFPWRWWFRGGAFAGMALLGVSISLLWVRTALLVAPALYGCWLGVVTIAWFHRRPGNRFRLVRWSSALMLTLMFVSFPIFVWGFASKALR